MKSFVQNFIIIWDFFVILFLRNLMLCLLQSYFGTIIFFYWRVYLLYYGKFLNFTCILMETVKNWNIRFRSGRKSPIIKAKNVIMFLRYRGKMFDWPLNGQDEDDQTHARNDARVPRPFVHLSRLYFYLFSMSTVHNHVVITNQPVYQQSCRL